MEFHRGSPEASFMCHVRAMEYKTPDTWRHLLLECSLCFGPKTKCSLSFSKDTNPLVIWLCVPCERAQPDIRDVILSGPSMKDDPYNIPIFHGPMEEIKWIK